MTEIHLRDARRPDGRYYRYPEVMRGQVNQYPVICAADIVEQEVTQRSRRGDVVTDDPRLATCPDCISRL